MKKIRIGVLCPSEIAYRRFMPALLLVEDAEFIGIAHASETEWFGKNVPSNASEILKADVEKAEKFVKEYGGKVFDSYEEIIKSDEIDAIYIPLPPALHHKWAKLSLENGKHVLVEKPSTTNYEDTNELVELAKSKGLALHENYMFNFHSQLDYIDKLIKDNKVGDVRLFRIAFGFPFRGGNDFRYNKKLGGGALLDCGGYTIKLARRLLGGDSKLVYSHLNYTDGLDVDIYGSGALVNEKGQTAQISFGMDNSYKCELEVWGSKGTIYTGRVLTAPVGFKPTIVINANNEKEEIILDSDDSFKKSITYFINCIYNENIRATTYNDLLNQSEIVDKFKEEI